MSFIAQTKWGKSILAKSVSLYKKRYFTTWKTILKYGFLNIIVVDIILNGEYIDNFSIKIVDS